MADEKPAIGGPTASGASASSERALIDDLYDPSTAVAADQELRALGAAAVPSLVRALKDPRLRTARYPDDREHYGPDSPFARICSLLRPHAPIDDASALGPFLEHGDERFREEAAYLLGLSATASAGPLVVQALSDEGDDVRASAITGIRLALRAGRVDLTFKHAVFPAAVPLLYDEPVAGDTATVLLGLDEHRARSLLLTKERLNPGNRAAQSVLAALNNADIAVPRSLLEPLLDPGDERLYGEALMALAIDPDAAGKRTLSIAARSHTPSIQLAATRALARTQGIVDPFVTTYERATKVGFDRLTEAKQRYLAAMAYDGEVRNGGHSQYFFNSSGDHWRVALEGLLAVGAAEKAAILRAAVARLGEKNLPSDRSLRNERLARVLDGEGAAPRDGAWGQLAAVGKLLTKLDDRYYDDTDDLDLRLARYVLDHAADFRPE